MANPKYKTSRSKTRRRRSHLQIERPNLIRCSRCHEFKLSHSICWNCGYYKGREVIDIEKRER